MTAAICKHCESSETRCASMQGCCPKCSHTFGEKARTRVARAVSVLPTKPPRNEIPRHSLNLRDPLDRLYLELLPNRISTPEREPFPPASERAIEALVREVCPVEIYREGAA